MLTLLAALLMVPTAASAEQKLVRLDPRVQPVAMELRLDLDPDRDHLLGHATIDVRLPAPTTRIQLHGRRLTVAGATVARMPARYAQLDDEGLAELALDAPVGPGIVRIDIEYRAQLGATLEGVYAVTFEERRYLSTQMEAMSARDVFPCFDEPGFKMPVALTLFVDSEDVAVANSAEVARAQLPDGRARVTFARTPPLPTYLIAFAVGPWDIVEGRTLPPNATRKDPLVLRGLVPKGHGAKVTQALEMTAQSVKAIEDYTGVGYAYGKLDLVAVPDFAWGGMENAGLITYRDSSIYLEPSSSIERQKGTLGLVAHEVAHHWFGNLVTAKWWDDIWLNEAFATWMAFRVVEGLRPDFLPRVNFRNYTEYVIGHDSMMSARQVRQPIETKADVLDAFDGVTYGKGASVIRMFEGYVGRDKFQRGIRSYLAERRHGNADAHELIDAIARNAKVDVRSAFFTFLDQPGVPYLDAEVRCDGAPRLHVSQRRFLPVGSTGTSTQTWSVPVCASADGKEFCGMVTGAEGDVDLGPGCPKAVLPDAAGRGYYRFALPRAQLEPLVNGTVPLTPEEKIAVSDAVRAGFASARLSFADALALAQPLATDPNPKVAEAPLSFLGFAKESLGDERVRARAMKRTAELYRPLKDRLGVVGKDSDSAELRELRLVALRALVYGAEDAATMKELLPLAKLRFGFDDGVIRKDAAPPDLTDVLGATLVRSEPAAAARLFERLKSETDPETRLHVLGALAATTDPAVADQLLALVLSKTLKTNELMIPLYGTGDDVRTRERALTWLEAHVDELFPIIPEANTGDVVFVGADACTEASAERLEKLYAPRITKWPLKRPLAQAVENIRLCDAKRRAHLDSAKQAFK